MRESEAEKIIVVTHHLPSFKAIGGRHSGNLLNAYANELDEFISGSPISAWIYGHSHFPTDLKIGNTHLVSNPLGYVLYGDHVRFAPTASIEI